jgi:para-aminobenzoate synthetase component 1
MRSRTATCQPLVEELRPAPDAWDVARRLADLPHFLWLDSARPDSVLGRYSILTADPFAWVVARRGRIRIERRDGGVDQREGDPFAVLSELLTSYSVERLPDGPPFQGGAAGLFGYDLCHHVERLPRPRFDEFAVPDLAVGLYDWLIAFDHSEHGRAFVLATGLPETDPDKRTSDAALRVRQVRRWLQRPPAPLPSLAPETITPALQHPLPGFPGVTSNFTCAGFEGAVARAIEYVHAGDCFQVNLSQRLLHRATEHPLSLYERLRQVNPAPFAGYFDAGDFVVASASPERFVKVVDGKVETRPIKGTRPRGATEQEDRARAAELLASAKDRAENVMIVDLLRNDLGRVCAYGSVRVEAVCRLESYQTVHHLVSEVRGRLRPEMGPIDLLRAAFPGGSVTGAPKVRAMQIIAELEPTARGPYCGSLGYVGFDGSADTSILIRTFTAGKGWVQFPVGGGIVADSDPATEYAETLHKAAGLLRALRA